MDNKKNEVLSRLLLLGTVHGDPDGLARARRFLDSHQPDLVLVELSPFGLSFRRRHQGRLQRTLARNLREAASRSCLSFRQALKHSEIRSIRRQLALPFEFRAAASYAGKSPSRLLLVDSSTFSRTCIESWPELISTENLVHLLATPGDAPGDRDTYRLAARRIEGGTFAAVLRMLEAGREVDSRWEERERFMAEQIRAALDVFRPRLAIYLGGWWHLTSGGGIATLRDLLETPFSCCHLLGRDLHGSREAAG